MTVVNYQRSPNESGNDDDFMGMYTILGRLTYPLFLTRKMLVALFACWQNRGAISGART